MSANVDGGGKKFTCSRCHRDDLTEDDFPIDLRRTSGRYPWCKPCKAAYMREKYPERYSDEHPGPPLSPVCTGCGGPRGAKRARCNECEAKYQREYRHGVVIKESPLTLEQRTERRKQSQRESKRRTELRRYGTTPEEWDRVLVAQGNCCAICRTNTPTGAGAKYGHWHTDHDHATGKLRGLLCSSCNLLLGHAEDNPARLRAAANYLEKYLEKD